MDMSTRSAMLESPCPMPAVSAIIRSKPAALRAVIASASTSGISVWDCRVARDRRYNRGLPMAFIRIRSPRSAPPVFLLEGSQLMMATCISLRSCRMRKITSSVNDDFPAPPVPVIPITGVMRSPIFFASSARRAARCPSSRALACSATVIRLATITLFCGDKSSKEKLSSLTVEKSIHRTIWLIMP